MTDSPVIISDDDNEDYFSPPTEGKASRDDSMTSVTERFAANFTATGKDMIDLTMDSSNPSSGVQTPESSQQPTYPHIKLLDFLSPGVSPKDLATSIKKQSNITSSHLSTGVTNSPAVEPASGEIADISIVPHYGVTARSPDTSDNPPVASSVRQISPPQNPDELKRATLLPLDKRITTPATSSLASPQQLMSARVSIRKLDSPSSALTASIARGTVSLRKDRSQRQVVQSPLHLSNTSITSSSNLASSPYKFSPPVEVLSPDKTSSSQAVKVTPHPPNVSFPFSPPLTRSRRRQTMEQNSFDSSKVELFTEQTTEVDADPSVDMPEVNEPKESGKKKPRVSTTEVTTTRTYRTRYALLL